MNNAVWSWSWICMILGVFMVAAGRAAGSYRKKLEPYKGRAEATVIDIVADAPDKEGMAAGIHDYYYPVIAYYAGGRLIKKTYPRGSNPCEFYKNQKLKIYYDEKHPSRCKIAEADRLKKLSFWLYYGGFVAGGLGCILFVLYATRHLTRI